MDFVCSICGNRQAEPTSCDQCGVEGLLDLRKPETLRFLEEVEDRYLQTRQDRGRWLSVGVAILVVVVVWLVPGFWDLRRRFFALPFLVDQFVLMGLIGAAMTKVLDKKLASKRRFPFLQNGKLVD